MSTVNVGLLDVFRSLGFFCSVFDSSCSSSFTFVSVEDAADPMESNFGNFLGSVDMRDLGLHGI